MTETSTTFTCEQCNLPFERDPERRVGRKPRFCKSCRGGRKRAYGRAYAAATYVKRVPGVPEAFQCLDCPNTFEHTRGQGRTPDRCRPCQARRNNERTAELRRINGRSDLKFAPGERHYPCQDCGASIACAPTGRKPERCGNCGRKRRNEANRRPPRSITCIDCAIVVTVQGRGASKMKRCPGCAKKRARVIQKRMAGERRALMKGAESEKFEDREIFERDGWRCGLCRKKINQRLKHPHPMSASLDHIIPLTKGGSHTRAGVQASHLTCNLRKYNLGGGEQLLLVG